MTPAFVLTGVLVAAALTGALALLVLSATKTYRKLVKRRDARWRLERGWRRAPAACRLGRFGSTRSGPYVSWQHAHPDYEVLDAAEGALSHDRGPDAMGPLLDAVERRRVAQVIGRGGHPAQGALGTRPQDEGPEAQRESALALARVGEAPFDTGPTEYCALRESTANALVKAGAPDVQRSEVSATLDEPTPLGALRTTRIAPPPEGGPMEPLAPAEDAPEIPADLPAPRPRRRTRRWDARRLYTSAICREFIDGLSDDVLERSEWLFRALWRIGHVDSEQLADLMGCTPTSLSGLVMTPLSRRAKDLGLPLPYVVARAPNGRRIWRDQGNVASRMTIAIQQEISIRADL